MNIKSKIEKRNLEEIDIIQGMEENFKIIINLVLINIFREL